MNNKGYYVSPMSVILSVWIPLRFKWGVALGRAPLKVPFLPPLIPGMGLFAPLQPGKEGTPPQTVSCFFDLGQGQRHKD